MYFKKHKSTVKEFTNFSSLSIKDLEKIEVYYYQNLEAIKKREIELIDIENKNKQIRINNELQKSLKINPKLQVYFIILKGNKFLFIKDYNKYIEVWKKYLKIDENINLLLPDELLILSKFDFRDPKDIPHPPYKHPRVNFLVFDDLVGDPHAFKKSHSAINNLCIKHRHLQCNLLFTTQYMKAIPPV
jgi:hypothetical protein